MWRTGCDCSAAGSGPEDSSPVSFHGRMRDDATMKIVPLIPLCLVSSATSHNGLNSILPLSIKAPVVAVHCHALFGARKKGKRRKIMLVGTALALLFASFFSCVRFSVVLWQEKGTLRAGVTYSGLGGQVLVGNQS